MFDGRQVEVIAAAVSGDTDRALALLHDTAAGEPWETAVAACLTAMARSGSGVAGIDKLVAQYHVLDTSAPGLMVFHTRLGLSFIDAIGTVEAPLAHRIATGLIDRATASHDGYAARDILAHSGCHNLLTGTQERALTDRVEACGLGRKALTAPLLADLTTALARAEEVMARRTTDIAYAPS
jgi:hypothetical protein